MSQPGREPRQGSLWVCSDAVVGGSDIGGTQAVAHIARAALDPLAETGVDVGGSWPDPPTDWATFVQVLRLTPETAQALVARHTDDGTDTASDHDNKTPISSHR